MSHTAAIKMQKPASTARAYDNFEKSLFARKRELEARIATLLGDVSAQTEPEDEGGIAIDNYSKDWAAANLERSRRTLREVDTALARIKQGNYGVCDVCNISIPKARLEALPWARVCVSCAERTAQTLFVSSRRGRAEGAGLLPRLSALQLSRRAFWTRGLSG